MPDYRVDVPRKVQKQIDRFPASVQDRLDQAIGDLARDPRPPRRSRKLSDVESRRLRVGDYRVIYEVDQERQDVLILEVWHRQRDYR